MHIFAFILLTVAALTWVFYGFKVAWGAVHLPLLRDFSPAPDDECPFISILFTARDEEEKLSSALTTMLVLDYPRYEIVAVDDRSTDGTAGILDNFARLYKHLRVIHISELPSGWLGKPHGLQKAWGKSSGEWLVFTDADARFAPDVLRRAISLTRKFGWDHLTLLGKIEIVGFWEAVIITFFGLGFHLATDPYRISDQRSSRYAGVGTFQLLRRATYEACGTHRRLAMEVVEDMKLGKIVKLDGFRSGLALAPEAVSVRWHAGFRNLVRGVTKNFFAASGFSPVAVLLQLFALFTVSVVPFAALFLTHGPSFILAAISSVVAVSFQTVVAFTMQASPLYGLTHPVGAVIFAYMLLRSMAVTLWQRGIIWRGTFYPLDELRRGRV